MAKALVSIDYTVDFVADKGKLTAGKPAQEIESSLVALTKKVYEDGDYIFFAIDCHDEGDVFHPETKLFPSHNIQGTSGRDLFVGLASLYESIKEDSKVFWMDKGYYSAFAGTDLDMRLRERRVDTVILTGVLTDICVLHTAVDAYNLGYQIEVSKSSVASLTEERNQWALEHFEHVLGARIID